MRTDADQERRNACGRADRKTAGPRSIACEAAPSDRWQIAPRQLERCFRAAQTPVAERGRLHGASKLDARTLDRDVENRFVYYRNLEEKRRCCRSLAKHNRLRRQDKRPHIAAHCDGCFSCVFRKASHIAAVWCNVCQSIKTLDLHTFLQCVESSAAR